MTDKQATIQDLKDKINKFVEERDWKKFHTPKNVSMTIAIEAAELMEQFRWHDNEQAHKEMLEKPQKALDELVDVVWMVMCLCNKYDIDFMTAFEKKLKQNQKKYPIEKSWGSALKYDQFD